MENGNNRSTQKNNRSGFKGVTWKEQNKKWEANIRVNKKQIYLGKFTDIKEAANAYNEAALEYHGKFARLNAI